MSDESLNLLTLRYEQVSAEENGSIVWRIVIEAPFGHTSEFGRYLYEFDPALKTLPEAQVELALEAQRYLAHLADVARETMRASICMTKSQRVRR